jgi:antiviral helicase SKI2
VIFGDVCETWLIQNQTKSPAPRIPATALSSTSLSRAPAPTSTFVRGKSGYMPFRPGGLDDIFVDEDEDEQVDVIGAEKGICMETLDFFAISSDRLNVEGLRTVPPGFSRGLRFDADEGDPLSSLEGINDLTPEELHVTEVKDPIWRLRTILISHTRHMKIGL